MKKLTIACCWAGAIALLSQPSWAAESWRIIKLSGQAWVTSPQSQRTDLSVGAELPFGATLFTGERSRVMIVRGADNILVGPKSILAVRSEPSGGVTTTVLERAGTAHFDVEKQNSQHFSVETPLLAAVVKGTSFTVSVSSNNANVAVARGVVEVASLSTGQTASIAPGQKAAVNAHRWGGGLRLSGLGSMPSITRGLPRPPLVSPLSSATSFSSPANTISSAEAGSSATTSTTASTPSTTSAQTGYGGGGSGRSSSASGPVSEGPPISHATPNQPNKGGKVPAKGDAGKGNGNAQAVGNGKGDSGNGPKGNGKGNGKGNNGNGNWNGNGNNGNGNGNGENGNNGNVSGDNGNGANGNGNNGNGNGNNGNKGKSKGKGNNKPGGKGGH
jgi:hypothetical protein